MNTIISELDRIIAELRDMTIKPQSEPKTPLVKAQRLAAQHSLVLVQQTATHYQLIIGKKKKCIYNLYPTTGKVCIDPHHPGPRLSLRQPWTVLDAVKAAIERSPAAGGTRSENRKTETETQYEIELRRYVDDRCPTGDFLYAVLSNDLFEAMGRADENNRAALFDICKYIWNELPSICWGSPEKVRAWFGRTESEPQ